MAIRFPNGSVFHKGRFLEKMENARLHHKQKKAARNFKREVRQQLLEAEDAYLEDRLDLEHYGDAYLLDYLEQIANEAEAEEEERHIELLHKMYSDEDFEFSLFESHYYD